MRRLSSFIKTITFTLTVGTLLLGAGAYAQQYHPAFKPGTLKGPPAGTANEVLVLGTPHLSNLNGLKPDMLTPLMDRLAAWRPTGIATEDLSGLQCDALRRYPIRYADTVENYCSDTSAALKATGLDVHAANSEAERLLAKWPAAPLASERRHLAALFLAAGEPGSALVQWLRLAPVERKIGDGLDAALVAELNKRQGRMDETAQIAAVLAARLGLERLWSVDDHSADTPEPTDPAEAKARDAAIMRAWDNPTSHARMAATDQLKAKLAEQDGLLNLYRLLNAPDEPMLAYRSDFGAALIEKSKQ